MNRVRIFLAALLSSYFIYTCQSASQSCSQIQSESTCTASTGGGCTWLNGACKCASDVKLDILFAVDTSGSIGFSGFQIQKNFIRGLVDDGISDDARIGFIMFSTNINKSREIQDWTNRKNQLTRFVDGMYWTAGWTNTPDLLGDAIQEFDSKYDADRQQILMLITDGNPCLPGDCPQSVCNQAPAIKQKGIRVIIIGVGDGLNTKYVKCLTQSDDDFIPVQSFSDEDFDSILGSLSDVLCPVIKEVKITEVKAHKVTSAQNFRMQRFVEVYNTGIDFPLSELQLSGLISTSGTFPTNTILQGQYLIFYDAANSAGTLNGYSGSQGSSGVVSCHLCPTGTGQCNLATECGANDIGNTAYLGYCWCQNSVYVACGNTQSGSSCSNLPTSNPNGPNVINACSICTFNDAMSKGDWDITITDTVGSLPIDTVDYDSNTWILTDDGYSYELASKGFDNDFGGNWGQSCSQLGTPGADPAAQCEEECITGGCGSGGVCNPGNLQCDCDQTKGLYPICLDTSGQTAKGCTKCGEVPPTDRCEVAILKNGTQRYAIFNWTQTKRSGFTKYKISYFQQNAAPLDDFTYSNLFLTNNYDPTNKSYAGFVQTAVVECSGCDPVTGCDPECDPNLATCNCQTYLSDKTLCVVTTLEPTVAPTAAPTSTPTPDPTPRPTAAPTLGCPYYFFDNDAVCNPERCGCNKKPERCCLLNPDLLVTLDANRQHSTEFACKLDEELQFKDERPNGEAAAGTSPGYLLNAKQHNFAITITTEPLLAKADRSVYPCKTDIYWRLVFDTLACDYDEGSGGTNANCDPTQVSLAGAGLEIDVTSGHLVVWGSDDVKNASLSFTVSRLDCDTGTDCYDNVAIYGDLEIVNATASLECQKRTCFDGRIYPMRIPVWYNYNNAFVAPPSSEQEIPSWIWWIVAALVVFLGILMLLLYRYWWKNKATGAALGSAQEELDAAVMEQEDGFGADLGNNAVGFNPLATGFNPNAPAGAVGPNGPPNGQGGGGNFIKPNVEKTVYRQDYGAQMGNLR